MPGLSRHLGLKTVSVPGLACILSHPLSTHSTTHPPTHPPSLTHPSTHTRSHKHSRAHPQPTSTLPPKPSLPPSLPSSPFFWQENIYRNFGMPTPNGYRKALRFMRHADKFGLPIITFVDTPGAYAGGCRGYQGSGESGNQPHCHACGHAGGASASAWVRYMGRVRAGLCMARPGAAHHSLALLVWSGPLADTTAPAQLPPSHAQHRMPHPPLQAQQAQAQARARFRAHSVSASAAPSAPGRLSRPGRRWCSAAP